MRVTYEGRDYSLSFAGKVPTGGDETHRSGPHLRARALLARLFPMDVRAEEVELPGTGLTADFVLPQRRLVVEIDGRQHREFVPFFHGTYLEFLASRGRDRRKAGWCESNDFRLVRLSDEDDDDAWERLLRE